MSDGQKTVLIIEDEQIIIDILSKELEQAGYTVLMAHNGTEGLNHIYTKNPDIVLLDLLLPEKSGFEVMQELKEKSLLETLPVIVISNSGQPTDVERLLDMGAREVLTKINFNPTDVVEKVNSYFAMESKSHTSDAVQPTQEAVEQDGSKSSILIVEDDPFIGELIVQEFKKHFSVHRVTNADDASSILAKESIDAILLDIMLPGKDGLTYLKELRTQEKYKNLPIILASNLGQKDEVEKGMAAGAHDYVIKANYLPEEIVKHVQKAMKDVA